MTLKNICYTNERGEAQFTVAMDSAPFECWVTTKDYKTANLRLDPKSPPSVVFLEDGERLSGRVIAELGDRQKTA